jgi:hypothetical protein
VRRPNSANSYDKNLTPSIFADAPNGRVWSPSHRDMQLFAACDELCFPGQPRVVLPEHEISKSESCVERPWNGGADRDRTCDLLIANETLYQLSYDPIPPRYLRDFLHIRFCFGLTLRSDLRSETQVPRPLVKRATIYPHKHRSGNVTWVVNVGKKINGKADLRRLESGQDCGNFQSGWNLQLIDQGTDVLTDLQRLSDLRADADRGVRFSSEDWFRFVLLIPQSSHPHLP